MPPNNLDDTTYWKNQPIDNPQHLWLGTRTITIKRAENGSPIITKGNAVVVSLQGLKGDKGENGRDGTSIPGTQGLSGPVVRFRGEYDPTTTYENSSLDT